MSQSDDQGYPGVPLQAQPDLDTPEGKQAQSRTLARLLTRFDRTEARNRMLEKQLKRLREAHADLESNHAQLETKHRRLEVKYEILIKEQENIRIQQWSKQVHHAKLQAEYESLRAERVKLQAENEILQADNEPLHIKICRVRSVILSKIQRLKPKRTRSFKSR